MEYLAWNGSPAVATGPMAVSDVWRATANLRFDLSQSTITPFATFAAGLSRYHWEDWVDIDDIAGDLHRQDAIGRGAWTFPNKAPYEFQAGLAS